MFPILSILIKINKQSAKVSAKAIYCSRISNMDFRMEKERLLNLPIAEKRKLYAVKYTEPGEILRWNEHYNSSKDSLKAELKESESEFAHYMSEIFEVNDTVNNKIALWRGDITALEFDAIVNAANSTLLGGGGVDGAIHKAAGPFLKKECETLNGCETGDAKITGGYKLPAKYVIHTVGPCGEKPDLLRSCYERSLQLMLENKLRTIAFPCISTGVYGYPQTPAASIALRTVRNFLKNNSSEVDLIVFTLFLEEDVRIYKSLAQIYFPVEEVKKNTQ